MEDYIKALEEWDNLQEDVKQKKIFINHLKNYNQPQYILDVVDKISFKGILYLFDIEFEKLWQKLVLPQISDDHKNLKDTLREVVLSLLRHSIFNFLYKKIKDVKVEKQNFEKLNDEIVELFNFAMYNLFKSYDLLIQLSSLNENNDKKIIIREVEKRNRLAKQGEKFQGKNFSNIDIWYFEKIYNEYDAQKKNGIDVSYRQIALKIAKTEMGLSHDFEVTNFYKRFMKYHNKKKKK